MVRIARNVTGAILGAFVVGLSLPGVQAVRAEPAASAGPSGPMCRADAPLAEPGVVNEMAQALADRAEAEDGQPEVRVLNNRGYAYRPSGRTNADLQALAREIALQRRQARP